MPKPTDGVPRPVADRVQTRPRRRSTLHGVNRKSVAFARATQDALHHRDRRIAAAIAGRRASRRPSLRLDRPALPILVATIVAVASLLAVLPTVSGDAVGRTQGWRPGARIAVNGGADRFANQYEQRPDDIDGRTPARSTSSRPVVLPDDAPRASRAPSRPRRTRANFLDDGTLSRATRPTTEVADGTDLRPVQGAEGRHAAQRSPRSSASRPMTLWWANKLKNKDELKAGQELRIPPVSGLVYTVKDTDTLDTVAKRFKVDGARVVELNGLEDPTLVVGQVLVLPGAKGAADAHAQAHAEAARSASSAGRRSAAAAAVNGGGGVSAAARRRTTAARCAGPSSAATTTSASTSTTATTALDIAADYGSPVVAAAPGQVIFAGWKSNGGGYQVWIVHGSGIYTTYNHMSSIAVGTGENVPAASRSGGSAPVGLATGPHLHFEVWSGRVWDGGTRVNPLKYF